MNRGRVRKGTCRSRGAHVACTCMYNSEGARKKIQQRTYIWEGSRTPTRAYIQPGLVYMAGSERNAWSCSSGGLGQNRRWKRGLAYRRTEETDLVRSEQGPVDREGCGVPQNGRNGPPAVETGVRLLRFAVRQASFLSPVPSKPSRRTRPRISFRPSRLTPTRSVASR